MESESINQQLQQELRVVFDACEADSEGLISLSSLANLSRSHLGGAQLEELLEVFHSEDRDRIDFPQFCQQMVSFMNNSREMTDDFADSYSEVNVKTVSSESTPVFCSESSTTLSSEVADQGAFNENLKRSFQRTRSAAVITSSPNKSGNSGKLRKKVSQARLSVNTSSEDEAEDSFDRQIADSLSVARPLELQQPKEFLVRGSSLRSTVMRKQSLSNPSSPSRRRMYPLSDSDSDISESIRVSIASSVQDLERKVEQLTETAMESQQIPEELPSSMDSMRDLEEEIQSSVSLARRHGEERLECERRRHKDIMEAMERELDLERRNFQLRFEQVSSERDSLRSELVSLRKKVELLSVEKSLLEQQVEDRVRRKAMEEEEEQKEEQSRCDREEELLNTVKTLSERVAAQDQDLAEVKEDNIVLRKQLKDLTASKENRETGRFRMFGGNIKENCGSIEDPQDIRLKLKQKEKQLSEQEEANRKLNVYLEGVLANVMASNPQILEKC